MRSLLNAVVILITLLIFGCATPYGRAGFMGGYTDTQIDSNTVMVSYRGNAFTSQEKVESSLIYRCAEVTEERGFDYFIIVSSSTTPIIGSYTTPGTYTSYSNTSANLYPGGYGNYYGSATTSTQGYYQPGQTYQTRKVLSSATIKMFTGTKPPGMSGAYTAKDVISHMKTSILKNTN